MSQYRRGDHVRHTSSEVIGATHGVVLASFVDLRGRPCVAVEWSGGYLGVSREKWIDRHGGVTYVKSNKKEKS